MTRAEDKLALPVQRWMRDRKWSGLRDIQARAVDAIIGGDGDLIISAATAGGKTEAAFLPLISSVLDDPSGEPGFDLVYIGPLRALISDQARRLEGICAELELPVVPWHGDISSSIKTRALEAPRGVLLITPESLEALFVRRDCEIGTLFGATRCVVIDELHGFLDSERGVQLRSLLTRLENAVGRKIRRVGLSATLGDIDLARGYLRPDEPDQVTVLEDRGGSGNLDIGFRGFLAGADASDMTSATDAIARHIFDHLRGKDNLVFAGSRGKVEIYADRLRAMCEAEGLPQEFYVHHASLSPDHRSHVEERLKDAHLPTTAICTSTLELGIDIGDVTSVAQIGAPFTVAGLRQRVGRSGRRPDRPAILRQYVVESPLDARSNFSDRLRLGTVRAIAMIELLLDRWSEPPAQDALHISTLVHQILSVIAEHQGASAAEVYRILCQEGPFRKVDRQVFVDLLRAIGPAGSDLIEQDQRGHLLLGRTGEWIVNHHSFYAVFPTPEEYRLVSPGEKLGKIPLDNVVSPGMLLLFSGRRWQIKVVDYQKRVIEVAPASAGNPPRFGGEPGVIHDTVVERMFAILASADVPRYLDALARNLLAEARESFQGLSLDRQNFVSLGDGAYVLATRSGTVKTTTLALALRGLGFTVQTHDGFLEVFDSDSSPDLRSALAEVAEGGQVDLFADGPNLHFEKFHKFLTEEFLRADALSSRLAPSDLPGLCERILEPTTL